MLFFLSFFALSLFFLVNLDFLHWKTFYQTFIGQLTLSILLFFLRKEYKLSFRKEYFFLVYMIFLGSFIASSTEFFYKLGRNENALDVFRHFVGLIPIVFFTELAHKDFKKKRVLRFLIFSVFLLTSISFHYIYFKIPEFGFFLGLPFFIYWIENKLTFTKEIQFIVLLVLTFLVVHAKLTYTPFTTLILYSVLFLSVIVFVVQTRLSLIYFIVILFLNLANLIFFEIQTLGEFRFFQKVALPILNTNRVSNYYALFITPALYVILIHRLKSKTKLFLPLILFSIILFSMSISYSRGAFIALLFGLFSYISFIRQTKLGLILFSFLVFLLLFPVWFFLLLKANHIDFLNYADFTSGRLEFWQSFIQIFLKLKLKEKLFGLGLGEQNFFISFVDSNISGVILDFIKHTDGSLIHPHNLFLSILFYFGLLGIFFLGLLIFFTLKKIYTLNQRQALYSISLIVFLVHNVFDSLENTLSLVVVVMYFLGFLYKDKKFFINENSYFLKILFGGIIFFLVVRSYQVFCDHKNFSMQKQIWKDVRTCQFSYVPEISKIQKENQLIIPINFLTYTELRRNFENLLYTLNYYKKFPTVENYLVLEKTSQMCNEQYFYPVLCKFYEENKIAIILGHYDQWKDSKYPKSEIINCFKN